MSFRTGPQAPLGNGSTLSLMGFQEDKELAKKEGVESAYRVLYLANIVCDAAPPGRSKAEIISLHARALLRQVTPLGHMAEGSAILSSFDPTKDETRVIFWRTEHEEIQNPPAMLRSLARGLWTSWNAIEFAEYGGADKNFPLTYKSGKICPIQPYLVNLTKYSPAKKIAFGQPENDIPLGFDFEPAEKVASSMLRICHARHSWGTFHNYGLKEGQTLVELLREEWQMSKEEYEAGLRYLLENEYIAEGTGRFTHFLREKFVVLCWRKGLDAPIAKLG